MLSLVVRCRGCIIYLLVPSRCTSEERMRSSRASSGLLPPVGIVHTRSKPTWSI